MVMGEQTLETEVAVIGGGPGGYAAAFRAADLGLEVTLINQEERLGGVCLLRGCIPSKVLLEMSTLIHDAREARGWGLEYGEFQIDVDALRARKDLVIDRLVNGLGTLAERRDVQVIQARAVFEASDQVRLQGESDVSHVKYRHAILASGSTPIPPPDTEFTEGSRIMSSKGALALPDIPETLLVVGAGYNGVELGSAYAILGSRVTIVEMEDTILPGVDPDLVKHLARRLRREVEAIHLNTMVESMEEHEDGVTVALKGDVDEREQTFDRVLVAIGRRPNSGDMGLENTDVQVEEDGFIAVDEERRTDDQHVFAVGDVVGAPMLAHKAIYEGKIAAEVIAGEPAAFDVRCIPAVVYTDPQIAWCGLSEAEAADQGRDVGVGTFPWAASGRALTMGATAGSTKIIFDAETERVLGVGIVGRGAEDMIAEGALAVEMGAVAQDLALTVHPHPTLAETEGEAAEAFLGLATHIISRRQ
ncbi:MAG: dihydrolipoyl dehydrogenase [Anaerolineae bacterium]